MKRMRFLLSGILFLFLIGNLVACGTRQLVEEHINDPIAVSGDVSYYAGMDADERKSLIVEQHIEVSGVVSKADSFLIYIGDKKNDGLEVHCNFDEKAENIEKGDYITVDGVCDSSFSDTFYLYGCKISSVTSKDELNTEATTDAISISDSPEELSIKSPIASRDCEGKNYEEIEKVFKDAGFNNVKVNLVEVDLEDAQFGDGDVISVDVGAKSTFDKDEELPQNAEILINYCSLAASQERSMPDEVNAGYSIDDTSSMMYVKSNVNVRSIPDTSGEKLGTLQANETVTITGIVDNGWYRISYNGDGFVRGDFLTSEEPSKTNLADNRQSDDTGNTANTANADTTVVPSSDRGNGGGDSGPSVIVPSQADTEGDLVWVPTNGGKKYHSNPGCSGMENPIQVTREHAEANGFTPCKRCH